MKYALLSFLIFVLLSCENNTTNKELSVSTKDSEVSQPKKKPMYLQEFIDFRDAVYHNDRKKVKSFFKFPIIDSSNEIRYLIGEPIKVTILSIEFSEEEFDKHYSKIISRPFILALLKVKSEELFKNHEFSTPEFQDSSNTKYQLNCSIDTIDHTLHLNLNSDTPSYYEDEHGNKETENIEFSVMYTFILQPDGHIRFKKIQLAG